jgi:hypothetical protein
MGGDGKGVLYFGEPVFHMFDFIGDGAEEVITLDGGQLKIYGYRHANHERHATKQDPEYLKARVANHTHY